MDTFTVTLPGHPSMVRVVRALASRAADLADLGFDRVEDLGLAIDEAASAFLTSSPADALTTEISHRLGEVQFRMSVGKSIEEWPPAHWTDSIASLVLGAIADEVVFGTSEGGSAIDVRLSARAR